MSRNSKDEIVVVELEVDLHSIARMERLLKSRAAGSPVCRVDDLEVAFKLLQHLCEEARIENP